MAEFHKKIYVHDISTMTDGDFFLGAFQDFYVVTVTLEATGLDAADASVSMLQRSDAAATWKVPTGLTSVLSSTPYSEEFSNGDFGSQHVGVRIAKNSCTTGVLTFYITAKSDN